MAAAAAAAAATVIDGGGGGGKTRFGSPTLTWPQPTRGLPTCTTIARNATDMSALQLNIGICSPIVATPSASAVYLMGTHGSSAAVVPLK